VRGVPGTDGFFGNSRVWRVHRGSYAKHPLYRVWARIGGVPADVSNGDKGRRIRAPWSADRGFGVMPAESETAGVWGIGVGVTAPTKRCAERLFPGHRTLCADCQRACA
jgi:hypothetical protein